MNRRSIDGVTKRIGAIKFSCLSPEEITKMSVVNVITADTYDDESRPIDRGLMDTRMGVIEPGLRCKTCGCNSNDCPGHFGRIELARPVIHVGFIKDIKMLLESTCCKCGRLMLSPEQIKDRLLDESDGTQQYICGDPECGHIAILNNRGDLYCPVCGEHTNIHLVQTSYAFKLLMDELLSLGVAMRLQLEDLR